MTRKSGELRFKPWDRKREIQGGTTLKTRDGIVYLNFMGSVEVQLGSTGQESELILERPVKEGPIQTYVLGLAKGEVWIHSHADCPIVLKMPHGEVRGGSGAYFRVYNLERDKEGKYRAFVQISSPNVTVTNPMGSVSLPAWGLVRVDETQGPFVLQDKKRRR
jgi:hypothetical protein